MTNLRNALLATIAYYNVLDFPLTALEAYKFLVNPARLEHVHPSIGSITFADVVGTLDALVNSGQLIEQQGFYVLPGREHLIAQRLEREKIASRKFKRLRRLAQWFQLVPYLRGMWVSGSLALGNATPESDYDVLAVTHAGRLYSCRMFLSLLASLLGARRTRHDEAAPDKFCFNHYITERSLHIPYQSLYTAQMYAGLKPLIMDPGVAERFYFENVWLNKFIYTFRPGAEFLRRHVRERPILRSCSRLTERVLDTLFGDALERILRKYQQRRIRLNPVTHEPGGRTVFSDDVLEFHPRSAEKRVLERYNDLVAALGTIWNYRELDSGLKA